MKNTDYIRDIIIDPEKLSQPSREVNLKTERPLINKVILELKNTLREKSGEGVALSAIQIGYPLRIFVANFKNKQGKIYTDNIITFINPLMISVKGMDLSREECISIPNREYIRNRYHGIGMAYTTPMGEYKTVKFMGTAAKIIQHHLDHLDGVILPDLGLEIDEEFDKATDQEREEVIKAYIDSLDIKLSNLKEEIDSDADLKQLDDTIEKMTENFSDYIDELKEKDKDKE